MRRLFILLTLTLLLAAPVASALMLPDTFDTGTGPDFQPAPANTNPCAGYGKSPNVCSLIHLFVSTIATPLISLILALAVVYFIAGLVKYLKSAGDEDSRREAVTMIMYGVIGLFVMVSVWGLVNLLQGTFPGLSGKTDFPSPKSLIN